MALVARSVLLLLMACIFPFQSIAQRNKDDLAFAKGIILMDIHTSLGLYRTDDRDFISARVPCFVGSDVGITDNVAVGLYGGWDEKDFKGVKTPIYSVQHYHYGLRLQWHFAKTLKRGLSADINLHKVDLYSSVWAGYQKFSDPTTLMVSKKSRAGIMIGTRLYPLYKVAVLVEAGIGPYGVINLGISTKL